MALIHTTAARSAKKMPPTSTIVAKSGGNWDIGAYARPNQFRGQFRPGLAVVGGFLHHVFADTAFASGRRLRAGPPLIRRRDFGSSIGAAGAATLELSSQSRRPA